MSKLSVDHLLGIKYLKMMILTLFLIPLIILKRSLIDPLKKYPRLEILLLLISFLKTQHELNYHLN